LIEEIDIEENFAKFKKEELDVIKGLYKKYDDLLIHNSYTLSSGLLKYVEDSLSKHNFLSRYQFLFFRRIFTRFYDENYEVDFPFDRMNTVNFIIRRNKYCTLMMTFIGLMTAYYCGSISKEDIKETIKESFGSDFSRVPIFEEDKWEDYDIFDIKNKIFLGARSEIDEYIKKYPSLLGKNNRQGTYEVLTRKIECAMY
jgi:hypothetical protein